MRVLVCGSRTYCDEPVMNTILTFIKSLHSDLVIIQGEARGADLMAKAWAVKNGVLHLDFPANWTKYGKAAGPIRNNQMLTEGKPDLVLAFPTNGDLTKSKGTKNMVEQARNAGIETVVVDGIEDK